MRIGIIAIQGNVSEHINALQHALNINNKYAEIITIKHKGLVPICDALIIPGGESTTLGKLLLKEGIAEEIKLMHKTTNIPIMGTCAGLILLAKIGDAQILKTYQHLLGLMDIKVNRNAFGRQRESFETAINLSFLDAPFNAVFIRAPAIVHAHETVNILGKIENLIVAAEQKNILALAFHPELTADARIHTYFLNKIISKH